MTAVRRPAAVLADLPASGRPRNQARDRGLGLEKIEVETPDGLRAVRLSKAPAG
ncbi:MAG: hypothetical protein M3P95_09755 [Actinomycetota bacterium]|nr:hypothetical protein [Actinomycetota bacterium]